MNKTSSYGINLLKLINKFGLTQVQFADKINVSEATVSNWVNGKKFPRMNMATKIANYFNTTVSNMLSEDMDTTPPKDDFEMELRKYENEDIATINDTLDNIKTIDDLTHKEIVDLGKKSLNGIGLVIKKYSIEELFELKKDLKQYIEFIDVAISDKLKEYKKILDRG